MSHYTITKKCLEVRADMAVSGGNQVSWWGSLLPSLSRLMSSVCWLHSLLLKLIFTPVVKEDDCWQPQHQTSLAPRLRQKADPVDPCKILIGWAWVMCTSLNQSLQPGLAWVSFYLYGVGESRAPHCGTSWTTWCVKGIVPPKERAVCTQYLTTVGVHLAYDCWTLKRNILGHWRGTFWECQDTGTPRIHLAMFPVLMGSWHPARRC